MPLSVSEDLRDQVEAVIRESIAQTDPKIQNVVFQQLYPEIVDPNKKVRAHFRYSFLAPVSDNETAEQTFEGILLLNSEDGGENWVVSEGYPTASQLKFKDGSNVKQGSNP